MKQLSQFYQKLSATDFLKTLIMGPYRIIVTESTLKTTPLTTRPRPIYYVESVLS